MRAIDTNILVRFLADPETEQALQARSLMRAGNIYISVTVLLESEWVLRTGYRFTPIQMLQAFRAISGLPGIVVEDSLQVAQALDWAEQGMDFADALHLARAKDCSVFITFDRKLAKIAAKIADMEVKAP